MTLENGSHRLSRNVGKDLPLLSAYWPRRAKFSDVALFRGSRLGSFYDAGLLVSRFLVTADDFGSAAVLEGKSEQVGTSGSLHQTLAVFCHL